MSRHIVPPIMNRQTVSLEHFKVGQGLIDIEIIALDAGRHWNLRNCRREWSQNINRLSGYQRNCKLSWRSLDLSHCGLVRGENHFHGIQITHIPPSNTLQIFSNGCQEITKRWRAVPRDRVSSSWIYIIQPWVKPSTPTSFRWGCFFWRFFSP